MIKKRFILFDLPIMQNSGNIQAWQAVGPKKLRILYLESRRQKLKGKFKVHICIIRVISVFQRAQPSSLTSILLAYRVLIIYVNTLK